MNSSSTITAITFVLFVIFSCSSASHDHQDFVACLSKKLHNYSISNIVYTPTNPSYSSILRTRAWNLRNLDKSSYYKPQIIITPEQESQVPPIILCARENALEIRTRSGGHDYEGASSVSKVPFVIIDLIRLSDITVDVEAKTAWVEAGANIGSLYYRIAEKSPVLGFPAGICPLVGVGGHISGGGYGRMLRKYGLAADHVIDARIVDANGRILDRKSMGEDLFWAIRGGGGASFGVIVAWKLQLVDVPEKVTVFNIRRTMEENATRLIHRWQYVAPKIDRDLYIGLNVRRVNSTSTISASFISVFLGGVDRLLPMMQQEFPELGLVRQDCTQVSWVRSTLLYGPYSIESPLEVLLNRTQPMDRFLKVKTDYVQKPLPQTVFEEILRRYKEPEGELSLLYFVPYGGRMDEISESAVPFPHRAGNLYMVANFAEWREKDNGQDSERYVKWVRRIYDYMTPYVSASPRAAYINYKDLDNGVNNKEGKTSYARARIWGTRYFKRNFRRLARAKAEVDPDNFFRHEQSIPPL